MCLNEIILIVAPFFIVIAGSISIFIRKRQGYTGWDLVRRYPRNPPSADTNLPDNSGSDTF